MSHYVVERSSRYAPATRSWLGGAVAVGILARLYAADVSDGKVFRKR
jgi:hypothetical protein